LTIGQNVECRCAGKAGRKAGHGPVIGQRADDRRIQGQRVGQGRARVHLQLSRERRRRDVRIETGIVRHCDRLPRDEGGGRKGSRYKTAVCGHRAADSDGSNRARCAALDHIIPVIQHAVHGILPDANGALRHGALDEKVAQRSGAKAVRIEPCPSEPAILPKPGADQNRRVSEIAENGNALHGEALNGRPLNGRGRNDRVACATEQHAGRQRSIHGESPDQIRGRRVDRSQWSEDVNIVNRDAPVSPRSSEWSRATALSCRSLAHPTGFRPQAIPPDPALSA
jgi:hypothetical protein